MGPYDVLELLRAAAFEPFGLHPSEGAPFEIRHPDMAIVQRPQATMAVPGPEGPGAPQCVRSTVRWFPSRGRR